MSVSHTAATTTSLTIFLFLLSFADIFYNNCFNNGMLPIKLSRAEVEELLSDACAVDNVMSVDLPRQVVVSNGKEYSFEIDAFKKHCLVNGLDKIGLTLERIKDIREFEVERTAKYGWLDGVAMKVPDVVKMYEKAPIWT